MRKSASGIHFEDVDHLVGSIYEGVTVDGQWTRVLDTLRNRLSANSALLIARNLGNRVDASGDEVLAAGGIDPTEDPAWREFREVEPAARFVPTAPPGVIDTPERLGFLSDARNSEFFTQFARPLGAHRSLYSWAPWPRDGIVLGLAFHREDEHGPFDDHERTWVQTFVPHIIRAARLRNRLHVADRDVIESDVLNRSNYCLVAVDTDLGVRWMNDRAAALLAPPTSVLRLERSTLVAHRAEHQRALTRAIRSVLVAPDARSRQGFDLSGPDEHDVTRVLVVPLPRRRLALVVVDRLSRRARRSVRHVTEEFGLTPAEAKIAAGIANGHTVKQTAQRQGISEGTARNYLKSALSKTGSRRQSLLIKTVLGRADASWDLE